MLDSQVDPSSDRRRKPGLSQLSPELSISRPHGHRPHPLETPVKTKARVSGPCSVSLVNIASELRWRLYECVGPSPESDCLTSQLAAPGAHPPRRRLKVAASAAPGPLSHGQAAARPFSLDSRQAQVSVRRNEDTVGLTRTRSDGCFLGRGNVRTQPTTSLKPKEVLTCRNVSCEHLSLADCEHFYVVYVQIMAAACPENPESLRKTTVASEGVVAAPL